ncbi:hypothetical protein IHE55_17975 [Streptomyces pactum]|uniref:Lipoprotein n=1 Tax=Streptomyces pactum TaxID=68249 RepID=A0ABS0NMY0_9ACTN|nr:hypothetical protein [Streptomyces pactum]
MGAAALLLAGCGIRGTSVPVDAGPAPSRASCDPPQDRRTAQLTGHVPLKVYLVCASQLRAVHRSAQLGNEQSAGDRLQYARELLEQLREEPSRAEKEAGFSSDVVDRIEIFGPAEGDPESTLRLNLQPQQLASYALAQLVCTYAASPATADRDGSVVLGGPETSVPPQRFTCSRDIRERPGSAPGTGVPVE